MKPIILYTNKKCILKLKKKIQSLGSALQYTALGFRPVSGYKAMTMIQCARFLPKWSRKPNIVWTV